MSETSKPILTVGCAVAHDAYGLYQTITDLRIDHAEVMPAVELVIVDDAPCNKKEPHECHSHAIQNFLAYCHGGMTKARNGEVSLSPQPADIRYIQHAGPHGTTQPRERIFAEASADCVLVLDSHVKLWPGALSKLIDFYKRGHDKGNLLQGVLIYDDLVTYNTQFDDVIRGNMWGTWGTDAKGRGRDPSGEPFPIPAQGLGLFSCRKSAWLGFNPRFRGFGGEEWYIHEKFRKHGKETLCLPFLRWVHRFMRVGGTGYVNDVRHRVRNYLIGFQELGLPVDRLRRYFRDGIPEDATNDDPNRTRISPMEYDILADDLGASA